MYFKNFPTIPYDSTGTGVAKDVKNLLRRVMVRQKVKSNTLFYDTYDLKNGETPESIADKLYDDPELHWVVLLVNDITDRYHQWPMTATQFEQFVNDKYTDPNGVHHYEIAQSSGDTTKKIEVYASSALYSGDNDFYGTATTITNIEYEENRQDELRQIRLLDPKFISQFVEEFENLMKESII
tara:strand:- start:1001 stop:1549 length:549 start_codon:yes stop_codon:yes gene_type:complete